MAEGLTSGWDLDQELNSPSDHLKSLLKTYTVEFLCRMQDQNCLLNMTNLYTKIPEEYFYNPNTPNPYDNYFEFKFLNSNSFVIL